MLTNTQHRKENNINTKSKASVQSPKTKAVKPVTHFTNNEIEGLIVQGLILALRGWWNAYNDYLVSGYSSVRSYAEASAEKSDEHTFNTIKTNLGYIKWAVDKGHTMKDFKNFGCLIKSRNPNQAADRHKTKVTVAETVTKTEKQYAVALGKACRKNGLDAKTTASIIRDAKAELNLR